jgi:beta-N-acetylhexosaminidase
VLALAAGCDLLCIGTENTDEQLDAIERAIVDAVAAGRLNPARVAEASDRVHGLADSLVSTPSQAELSSDSAEEDVAAVTRAFDIGPGARRWLEQHGDHYSVVRIDTVANIAVGTAPWGPFSEVDADPTAPWSRAFSANPGVVFTEQDHPDLVLAAQSPVLVIGKDNHRHPFARAAIDRLRAERELVLVVDMGWPSDDRAYADLATFGASRLVGRALLELLGRGT